MALWWKQEERTLFFFHLKRKSHQCQGCTLESDLARHPLAQFHVSPHQPLAMLFSDCHVELTSQRSRPLLTSNLRDNRDPFPGPVVRPNAASFALIKLANVVLQLRLIFSYQLSSLSPTHTHSDSIGSRISVSCFKGLHIPVSWALLGLQLSLRFIFKNTFHSFMLQRSSVHGQVSGAAHRPEDETVVLLSGCQVSLCHCANIMREFLKK